MFLCLKFGFVFFGVLVEDEPKSGQLIFFLLLKLKINILNYNLMWHATINLLLLFYSSVSLPVRLVTEGSFKDLNGTRKLI